MMDNFLCLSNFFHTISSKCGASHCGIFTASLSEVEPSSVVAWQQIQKQVHMDMLQQYRVCMLQMYAIFGKIFRPSLNNLKTKPYHLLYVYQVLFSDFLSHVHKEEQVPLKFPLFDVNELVKCTFDLGIPFDAAALG